MYCFDIAIYCFDKNWGTCNEILTLEIILFKNFIDSIENSAQYVLFVAVTYASVSNTVP